MERIEPRSLDVVERYHIAQHRAGSLPYITIIGLMIHPNPSQMVLGMKANINRLMRIHSVLVAAIDDTDSRRPRWIPNNYDPPFITDQYMLHPVIDAESHAIMDVAEIANMEDVEAQAINLAQGPLWRVGIYNRKLDPAIYYIALTIHHVVADGMGALNLFREILRPPPSTDRPSPKQPLPPKAEKTMRIQPSIAGTIKKGVQFILNHKSSWKVTRGIGVITKWPPPDRLKAPPRRPDVSHFTLDLGNNQDRVAERLEALGSQIGSVHAVLHTAAVIALVAATSDDIFDTLSTETPKSLRSEDRTHPQIGGNYTGMIERSISPSTLASHTVASFTKNYHDYIHSSGGESEARSSIGEFRLLPDRVVPDLWRAYLEKTANSDDPYRHSLSISNLGRFDPEDIIGLEKVWFCHASMP
jgi:NRPS condensation-like uncharacterized protein